MGHKEVGGVPSKLAGMSKFSHIMEQLEVDWKYDLALQTADNELFSQDIIRDAFVRNGLDVTFNAKPIEGVAGSGEHHHLGIAVKLSSGRKIKPLFTIKYEVRLYEPGWLWCFDGPS